MRVGRVRVGEGLGKGREESESWEELGDIMGRGIIWVTGDQRIHKLFPVIIRSPNDLCIERYPAHSLSDAIYDTLCEWLR